MNVADIISRKRDGETLADSEISELINGFSEERVPDYQMSAFSMAVFFRGMNRDETVALTRAMIDSGERIKWPSGRPKVDKHSTGGIGDKISIPLAPMLACCDVDVPMISGRGLGITGGTLDKLESIPGYRCDLSLDEFVSVVNWNGCSISGATANLAPADKRLYALRDVTGTIPSVPLITASILSKKIAEGISSLVLDVKCGSGAFMDTLEKAQSLSRSLVGVANQLGLKTTALITNMNEPLGVMIGNLVEVEESIAILTGEGPADATELTLRLGSELLVAAGVEADLPAARRRLEGVQTSGVALEKFYDMVKSQGGDGSALPERERERVVLSQESGCVSRINARRLGLAIIEMGGGRKQMGDKINHRVGIEFLVKIGERINKGDVVAKVYCDDPVGEYAAGLVSASLGIVPDQVDAPPLVIDAVF